MLAVALAQALARQLHSDQVVDSTLAALASRSLLAAGRPVVVSYHMLSLSRPWPFSQASGSSPPSTHTLMPILITI